MAVYMSRRAQKERAAVEGGRRRDDEAHRVRRHHGASEAGTTAVQHSSSNLERNIECSNGTPTRARVPHERARVGKVDRTSG